MQAGECPVTQNAFSLALGKHKVERAKQGVIRYGVKLAGDFDPQPDASTRAEYAQWLAGFA